MSVTNLKSATHEGVQDLYADAAQESKPGLCCPKPMPSSFTSHIPPEAFERNYGCGSPVLKAGIKPGDTVVDLGSGVGIDCFVAARLVGPEGRVIGIDMTDEMLARAYDYAATVKKNLGYDVVEFKKGLIEQLPLEDSSVDVLVSNCVLNLSPDKNVVFREIFRVLKHGGRMVISDIVSDRDIKVEDQADQQAWAECTTGAMSLQQLLQVVEQTGFVGMHQIDEQGWQEIKGYHLASITLEVAKFETDCHATLSNLVIYLGPFASVTDDLGNAYQRFKPTAVRDDVATYLNAGANASSFIVIKGKASAAPQQKTENRAQSPCCNPEDKVTPCCDSNEPKADGSPCCDPYAEQQPADCPCSSDGAACGDASKASVNAASTALAAPPAAAQASACCDGGGCGTSAAGASAAAAIEVEASADECCACESEAKQTGGDCCGSGCGTCGCE
ncbi:MAG: methyltransferase domain-containing protein [Aquisalimonadaceae bacterium]